MPVTGPRLTKTPYVPKAAPVALSVKTEAKYKKPMRPGDRARFQAVYRLPKPAAPPVAPPAAPQTALAAPAPVRVPVQRHIEGRAAHLAPYLPNPGERVPGAGPPRGKKLLTRVREILKMRSVRKDGRFNTRFDDVAEAFVMAMESGSFVHMKEFIEREEGRVPLRISDAEGGIMKMYINMPTDDTNAP